MIGHMGIDCPSGCRRITFVFFFLVEIGLIYGDGVRRAAPFRVKEFLTDGAP